MLAVRNLLPCALSFSFLLDGDDAPLPEYHAASGQLLAVHDFGLSRKVSIGLAIAGLEEASEFVPVFCLSTYMCVHMCRCIHMCRCAYTCIYVGVYVCVYSAGLEDASEYVPVFCLSTYMCVYMYM